MPRSGLPSGAKNGKLSKEKKGKNLAVLAKMPRLKRFFSAKLLWHVIFLVFSFVTSGFCWLFGWMLLLAESPSSLRKYFFLVKIHCSVYTINSLLAANCMFSCAPYLSDCKPRLIKFFHHLMQLTIRGAFHFLFFYFIERYRWRSDFPWLRLAGQVRLSHSISFSITCTSVTGRRDYDKQKAVVVM